MRTRSFIAIGFVALLCAAVATALVVMYLQKTAQEAKAGPVLTPVVVATSDLSFGQTLTASNLRIAMFPQESVPKGAISEIDSLIGQSTKVFLAENEPVLATKLSSIGGGLSLKIEPPLRGMSIKVDRVSGVSGFILPGDRVDVIAVVDERGGRRDATAKTILQNVEVLAAGEKTEKQGNEPITMQSVTLLVDIESAEKLTLAQSQGKVSLSLRNPNDTEVGPESEGVTASDLIRGKKEEKPQQAPSRTVAKTPPAKTEPAKPIVRPDTVTIFRGTEAKTVKPAMQPTPAPQDTSSTKPTGE
jgi:pilus assembly protein CpaB